MSPNVTQSFKLQRPHLESCRFEARPVIRKGTRPLEKIFAHPGKMCWKLFKTIGHYFKNLGPSQKTLRSAWCPKLVTGLAEATHRLFIAEHCSTE